MRYLRRRHTAGAAMAGREVGEREVSRTPTCSTWACCCHTTNGRGRRAREPAVRRHRRGSRLPRRVRLPRRKRPRAPPSPRRCLRREPAVRADVGDDPAQLGEGLIGAPIRDPWRRLTALSEQSRCGDRRHCWTPSWDSEPAGSTRHAAPSRTSSSRSCERFASRRVAERPGN